MREANFDKNVTANVRPDKRTLNKAGKHPVKLFITYQRNKKVYSVGMDIAPDDWDKMQSANLKDKGLIERKKEIEAIKTKAAKFIKQLGDNFTYELFEQLMFGISKNVPKDKKDVFAEFETKIAELRQSKQLGTAETYKTTLISLKKYVKHLEFSKITVSFLKGWEQHQRDNDCNGTTIGIRMRTLRHIVKRGVKNGAMSNDKYPFGQAINDKYEIPNSQNIKKALDEDVIKKIIEYVPTHPSHAKAKAMFLFIYYCNGMNFSDVTNLRYENVDGDFLHFYRQKTIRTRKEQVPVRLYLIDEAKEIIKTWGAEKLSPKTHIFGYLDDSMDEQQKYERRKYHRDQFNDRLRTITKRLGLNNNLSSYVARHSWATTLLRHDVPIGFISKGLGHSSIMTTEKYLADFTDERKKDVGNILSGIGRMPSGKQDLAIVSDKVG
ncbi:site-specific integrase [Dysgonomonas sp.]|uniref:site-specific integrase n=1 Tax=Dysgonomonas TaxID=156973 RepID=UPI0027B89BFD|nr:site-specific integrase [Dysgonomonas sp.]